MESSSGLKMKISLNQKTPFYLLRPESTPASDVTGATNLMSAKGLESSYVKLTTKKMKDTLSSFLSHLPGVIDTPGSQDNSSLRGIIEKPPVCGKELVPLNQIQLAGFRLHPGPLPEQYRGLAHQNVSKSKKRHRHSFGESPVPPPAEEVKTDEDREKRREKKHKKHDKDTDERRRKKKEKKRKKNKEDKDV